MADVKYKAGSPAAVMTTELDGLANNARAISGAVDNTADLDFWDDVELVVTYGTAPSAGGTVELYLVESVDGTNYGDGDADVVTADGWDLSVLLGDGTGALGTPVHSGSGYSLRSISVGDVDGDGNVDTLLGSGWGLAVQKGDGLGGFTAMPAISTGSPVNSAVIGDVNDDGTMDLVAAGSLNQCTYGYYYYYYGCYGYYTSTRQVTVLLGNGLGSFALPLTSNIGTESDYGWLPGVALADLDGDDLPELITIDYYSGEAIVASNDGHWNPPPSIGISDAMVVEGDSGTVNAVFTVTIVGDPNGVSVNYATASGTAVAGADYSSTSGTLTFGVGETSLMISVPIIGDAIDEYDEQFVVNLSSASGAQLTDSQGIGTIEDDDEAPLVTINDVSNREGNKNTTSFDFTVSLSQASGKWVYVDFATADGTATVADNDYYAAGWTVYIAPGDATATITVTVPGDRRREGDETFSVELIGASEATIADGQGIGTILNDDGQGCGKGTSRPKVRNEPAPPSKQPGELSSSNGGGTAQASKPGNAPAAPAGLLPSRLVDRVLADFNPGALDAELLESLASAMSGWQ
jgi:hypothetical protein